MTNFTKNLMVAAATLVVAAGAASAQTMKADIPFAFRANGKVMTAGIYLVDLKQGTTGVQTLYLYNYGGHEALLTQARVPHDAPNAWREAGNAVLSFQCGEKICSLTGVWAGQDGPAYNISAPKADEPTHMALINLLPEKGD